MKNIGKEVYLQKEKYPPHYQILKIPNQKHHFVFLNDFEKCCSKCNALGYSRMVKSNTIQIFLLF